MRGWPKRGVSLSERSVLEIRAFVVVVRDFVSLSRLADGTNTTFGDLQAASHEHGSG